MRWILIILAVPVWVFAWDFTQERNTIPVYFDSVQCQIPWYTGLNYINPEFVDLDLDGDFDLIVGADWNRLLFICNNGDSIRYNFIHMTDTLVNIPAEPHSQVPNCPFLIDIDSDSDLDLFVGTHYISPNYAPFFFYENTGTATVFNFIFREENFQSIQLNNVSKPFFVDIDSDSDYDLFLGLNVGATATSGRIVFYRNEGTPYSAVMVLVTDYFMNIDLGMRCNPTFIDIDSDGDYDMFLGDEDGNIHYYRNDGTPQQYHFVLVSQQYQGINVGRIASPAFCDIDADGDYDLFVGERSWGEDERHGDINFYENIGRPDSAVFVLRTQNFIGIDDGNGSTPTFADINNDGLVDLFQGEGDGNINYFVNSGTLQEPEFSFITETFENIEADYQSRPTFGDLDGDGDLDMLAGRVTFNTGSIHRYLNNGTPQSPEYVLVETNYLGIDCERPAPRLVDIDSDNDLDLFVGHFDNQVLFYENVGTPVLPQFVLISTDYLNTGYQCYL